jgi:hypothetical protein
VSAKRIDVEMVMYMKVSHVQHAVGLDVVAGNGAAVLELLALEDEALLVGGDALLVLDLRLHGADGVGGLDF